MTSAPQNPSPIRILGAIGVVGLGTFLASSFFQTCLSSKRLAANFVSISTWVVVAKPAVDSNMTVAESATVPFSKVFIPCFGVSVIGLLIGAAWLVIRKRMAWIDALSRWGWYGWWWWCLVDLWEWLWIAAGISQSLVLSSLLSVTPQFWLAVCLSGWLTSWFVVGETVESIQRRESQRLSYAWIWLACGVYVALFTTMNWRLYFNLLVPHGDSVMYEEHLWNLLHGKGFRSYLDRGLFLGEHIQFVHLFLLPLYVIWPSHLLLEACSSTALACGAIPVFWMVQRHTQSNRTALAAAVAYLLYAPMQFLDIEIDLKTFRPESFGIPLLLFTLDQLDRKSLVGTIVGILCCLTVKEDYCLIFGPLGVWIALSRSSFPRPTTTASSKSASPTKASNRRQRWIFGFGLSVFSVAYLWLATRVVMPWFRSGAEVHYASYFSRFGKTPEEILRTMVLDPGKLVEAFVTVDTAMYLIAMLVPVAFLPIFSPGRLIVGLPLFSILCLNELEGSRTPQHQFHAPLVAIVFWSLASALPHAVSIVGWAIKRSTAKIVDPSFNLLVLRHLLWTSSLTTGFFLSLSPLGISFWDSGSSWSWRRLYATQHRAEMFAKIATLIPSTARVASTDFVHPRYTHHLRSYDYSDYQRQVSGDGKRIPDDTEYLVIDTDHKYSRMKHPNEIPELREHPEQWELLPDATEGYFIVLKRRPSDTSSGRK